MTFACAKCGDVVPVHYRGPIGHAPRNVCFGCWCEHWAALGARMLNGGSWTNLDGVLWMIAHGATQQAAAECVGVHRNTVGRWIAKVRRYPVLMPEWAKVNDA